MDEPQKSQESKCQKGSIASQDLKGFNKIMVVGH